MGVPRDNKRRPLGSLEFLLLTMLKPSSSYGEELGRSVGVTSGAAGMTLNRMETKKLVTSQWGKPTAERGGKARRMWLITAAGRAALRQTEAFYSRSKT